MFGVRVLNIPAYISRAFIALAACAPLCIVHCVYLLMSTIYRRQPQATTPNNMPKSGVIIHEWIFNIHWWNTFHVLLDICFLEIVCMGMNMNIGHYGETFVLNTSAAVIKSTFYEWVRYETKKDSFVWWSWLLPMSAYSVCISRAFGFVSIFRAFFLLLSAFHNSVLFVIWWGQRSWLSMGCSIRSYSLWLYVRCALILYYFWSTTTTSAIFR